MRYARGGLFILLRTGGLVAGVLSGFLVLGWLATLLLSPAAEGVVNSVGFGVQVPEAVELAGLDQTSTIYAADGSVIAVLHDEVDRTVLPLDEIPVIVQNAVVAAEDRRFWEHNGYDVEGLGRALLENVRSRGVSQGGSTITQQLAKSVIGDEISLQRKLTEIAFAIALERELTKEEILERYLNQVYFGRGAYGVAAAAENYFRKDITELTPADAAMLAGQIRSPGITDPDENPDIALRRRNQTLMAMVEEGWLEPTALQAQLDAPLGVLDRIIERPDDPFIAEAVKQEFYTIDAFGADRLARNEVLLNGGLQIYTSFDPRLQAEAERIVLEHLPTPSPTAALAAVDPRTGQIRAIFGGSDFAREQYNFATQGRRQPGSSWKPFVMAQALEIGFSPSMMLTGSSPARFPTGDEWETRGVQNYGGGSYGPVTMRNALIRSVNTAFAQLMLIVGAENVVALCEQMGIDTAAATGGIINPSIALGGLENGVTPLEQASAYGTFALAGAHVTAGLIDRVEDQQGNVLYERNATPTQILDPVTNQIMVDTMQSVVSGGTATRASISDIGWRAAGKTGTAQSNADAWFIGYTPVLSVAVWMGHPEGRIRMPGETGGRIPATIWREFMHVALEGIEPIDFPLEPPGGVRVEEAEQGEVVVPDVRELDEFEALRQLAELGLPANTHEVENRAPAGTVVSQQPRGGTAVARGTPITLGVSTGHLPPPPTVAPSASEAPTTESTTPPPTAGPTAPPPEPQPRPSEPQPRPTQEPEPEPQPEPEPTAEPQPTEPQPEPTATAPPPPPPPPAPSEPPPPPEPGGTAPPGDG